MYYTLFCLYGHEKNVDKPHLNEMLVFSERVMKPELNPQGLGGRGKRGNRQYLMLVLVYLKSLPRQLLPTIACAQFLSTLNEASTEALV